MTIDELLDLPAESLEKLTEEELNKIFSPFFNVTRPELAPKPQQQYSAKPVIDYVKQQKLEKLKAAGIDLTGLLDNKKRKK